MTDQPPEEPPKPPPPPEAEQGKSLWDKFKEWWSKGKG